MIDRYSREEVVGVHLVLGVKPLATPTESLSGQSLRGRVDGAQVNIQLVLPLVGNHGDNFRCCAIDTRSTPTPVAVGVCSELNYCAQQDL